MRIMITGGGTGGHTSPALAVIEELRRRDPQLLLQWVGKTGGMEEEAARKNNIPFRGLPVEGWSRRNSPRVPWVLAKLAYCLMRAYFHIRVFQPQAVFGVGGYVSLPAIWMAQRMGVPTLLHEQNKRLGLANRICARRATALLLSYPETEGDYPRDRSRIVGNPVRAAFLHAPDRVQARTQLGLDAHTPTVLAIGGSQGAHSLNRAMAETVSAFNAAEAQFIWSTGKAEALSARQEAESTAARVQVHAYIEDMATACAAADLIVSRAGASSTAELAAIGRASLLVPYPHAADNHQEHNARAFEQAGAAMVLLDNDCTGPRLTALIRDLFAAPDRIAAMGDAARTLARPGAAEQIAEFVMETVHGRDDAASTRTDP